jgi:hypothetical protein
VTARAIRFDALLAVRPLLGKSGYRP